MFPVVGLAAKSHCNTKAKPQKPAGPDSRLQAIYLKNGPSARATSAGPASPISVSPTWIVTTLQPQSSVIESSFRPCTREFPKLRSCVPTSLHTYPKEALAESRDIDTAIFSGGKSPGGCFAASVMLPTHGPASGGSGNSFNLAPK